MSTELLVRLEAYPKMRDVLSTLTPKMLSLTNDRPAEPRTLNFDDEQLSTRVERVVKRIEGATFGNPNDKHSVPAYYKSYVERITGVLTETLAVQRRRASTSVVQRPPMPAAAAELPAWHREVLRRGAVRARAGPAAAASVRPAGRRRDARRTHVERYSDGYRDARYYFERYYLTFKR